MKISTYGSFIHIAVGSTTPHLHFGLQIFKQEIPDLTYKDYFPIAQTFSPATVMLILDNIS
jgi:hypothetical protein